MVRNLVVSVVVVELSVVITSVVGSVVVSSKMSSKRKSEKIKLESHLVVKLDKMLNFQAPDVPEVAHQGIFVQAPDS